MVITSNFYPLIEEFQTDFTDMGVTTTLCCFGVPLQFSEYEKFKTI